MTVAPDDRGRSINSSARNRPRWKPALATLLAVLTIFLGIVAAWLTVGSPIDPLRASDLIFLFSMFAYAALGWLVIVKDPENKLGWICLAFPLLLAIAALLEEFGLRAALSGSDGPAAVLLIGDFGFAYTGYLLLNGPIFMLFPNGQFPSRQFRWAFWAVMALMFIAAAAYSVSAEPVCVERLDSSSCTRTVPNPIGLVQVDGLRQGVSTALIITMLVGAGVWLAGLFARYRHSTREVRQQIKWVAWVMAVGVPLIVVFYGGQELFGFPSLGQWNDVLWIAVVSIGGPIAIGIAIFRYRLYEIDRLISRTTTYTLVAAVLAIVYAGGVALTQQVLPVQNQFGIVVSTLAVAALFNPLRRRVQNSVDRRFNRSRYDAQRVLEEFSAGLRDGVDLEQMQGAVLQVARETLQPLHLSLWVRERETEVQ